MTPRLPITGERTVPGVPEETYWFARHLVVYELVGGMIAGSVDGALDVLEAGGGEGYGAETLRRSGAHTVVGVDYDAWAVGHAAATYPRVPVVRANLVALPFRDAAFDLAVSLQTVEHLWEQPRFVAECARVLPPGGTLVLSTPNRLTFPPGNVFHARELAAQELRDLVQPLFEVRALLGVRHGDRLRAYEQVHGPLVDAQLAAPADEWPGHLAALVESATAADFVLTDDNLDTSLDLVLVARRR